MDVILAPTSNRRTECVLSFKKVNGFLLIKLNIAPPPPPPPSSYAFLPCFSAFAISVSCTPPKITQVDEPISVKKKKKAEKGRGHQISENRGVHTQPRVFCFSCISASWQHFTLSLFSFGRFVACTTTSYCVFTVQIPYKQCRASPGLPCHLCFPWQSVCSELFLIFNKSSYLFPYGLVLCILRA